MTLFPNPFRPGAGHPSPHLAGRATELGEFSRLLEQSTILKNLVLTGLRGVGKTVLLEKFKPLAVEQGWLWVGTDLSESTSVSEEHLARRLCTDLAPTTSSLVVRASKVPHLGFSRQTESAEERLSYQRLIQIYRDTPGLSLDKLKTILEYVWSAIRRNPDVRGIIFSYDEARNMADRRDKDEYPLSLLLDAFQSIQRKGLPLMLVLTGLPTLFPKLVKTRTFAERMFRVLSLPRLNKSESADAIQKPISDAHCPVRLSGESVATIVEMSGGYPCFIQFICREVYDAFIQKIDKGEKAVIPVREIEEKLDTDFFAGRWDRATDRQRTLLSLIATLDSHEEEFTVQEIVEQSTVRLNKPFSPSHVSQMLTNLASQGLVFKNRRGKYSFAVPLLGKFINRQMAAD